MIVCEFKVKEDGVTYTPKTEPEVQRKEFDTHKDYAEWSLRQCGHPFLYIEEISVKEV